MGKLTLKARILAYYRKNPGQHIASGEIQRLVSATTEYSPANATRRLRELAAEGELQVEQVKGHSHYWYVPPVVQTERAVVVEGGEAREVTKIIIS